MNRIIKYAAALALLAHLSTAWADSDQPEPKMRLELNLVDGSRIIGTPHIESVHIKTSYAKMDIPLKRIRTVTIADNHETASVEMLNGDSIKGAITLDPLKLETVFGSARVDVEFIEILSVTLGDSTWPREGLWGYWPLNGDAKDASGNKHDGVINNAKPVDGIAGKAFTFDGNSTIEIACPDFTPEEFTISGWIRTDHPARREDWRAWISKFDDNATPFEIYLGDGRKEVGDNDLSFMAWNSRREGLATINPAKLNLRDGRWHHCAVTYKKGSQKLFVDGKNTGESSYSGPLPSTATPITIGGRNFGAYHHPWIGDIDEVFIYQRALSDNEVQQLHRNARR